MRLKPRLIDDGFNRCKEHRFPGYHFSSSSILYYTLLCPGGTYNRLNKHHLIAFVKSSSHAGAGLPHFFFAAQRSQSMLLRPSQPTFFLFFLQLVLLSLIPAVHLAPTGIGRYETLSVRSRRSNGGTLQATTVTTVIQTNTYV